MTPTPAAVDGFAAQIRSASAAAHQDAEHSPFLDALAAGRLARGGAVAYTAQLYFVYNALEAAGDAHGSDPVAGPFVVEELRRLPALRTDLAALLGVDWRHVIAPSPATQEYVDRLRTVAVASPRAYVAHAYTRYLGDLSGGRVIRRWVQAALGSTDDAGTSFYVFDAIPSAPAFKKEFRARLDRASWDEEQRAEVVGEVIEAFRLNEAVLHDLGAHLAEWERPSDIVDVRA